MSAPLCDPPARPISPSPAPGYRHVGHAAEPVRTFCACSESDRRAHHQRVRRRVAAACLFATGVEGKRRLRSQTPAGPGPVFPAAGLAHADRRVRGEHTCVSREPETVANLRLEPGLGLECTDSSETRASARRPQLLHAA